MVGKYLFFNFEVFRGNDVKIEETVICLFRKAILIMIDAIDNCFMIVNDNGSIQLSELLSTT